MEPDKQQNHGLLNRMPRRLRSIPVVGAIAVGSLTVVAEALLLWPGPLFGFKPALFFASLWLFFLAGAALELFGHLVGVPAKPPENGNATFLIIICSLSVILNMLVVWGGLKLLGFGLTRTWGRFRRGSNRSGPINNATTHNEKSR